MDLGIRGKVAVVLAGTKGLGRGCAEAFAEEGASLAICGRGEEFLKQAAAALGTKTQVFAAPCDVTNLTSMEKFLTQARKHFGRVDILVNNCGGPTPGTFADNLSDNDWTQAFERCLMQVVRWTKAVAPEMMERRWGRIVNIVSTSVRQPIDGLLLSSSIRPGVLGFTKSVARELAEKNVLINSILPGSISTERTLELAQERVRATGGSIEDFLKKKAADVPMGRMGTPREIGDVAAFLCSERSSYITGTSLVVDGGLTKAIP